MKLTKFNIISIIIVLLGYFLSPVVGFVLATIITFIIPKEKNIFKKSRLRVLVPIVILLFIGFVFGFSNNSNDFFRDAFNVVKILVYFVLGMCLIKYVYNFKIFFKYISIAACISALIHIFLFLYYYRSVGSLDKLRELAGRGNFTESIYLSIVIAKYFNIRFNVFFQKKNFKDKVLFWIVASSFILYLSRSMVISTVLLATFLLNYLNVRNFRSKLIKRLTFIVVSILLLVPMLSSISYASTNNPLEWLAGKFGNIPEEIFWTNNMNHTADFGDINEHWRGYEAFQGILKFDSGTLFNKLFGFGWGSLVDLNMTMNLGGTDYNQVPVLHNGYVMLLVKSGIIGTLLYLFYLFSIGFRPLLAVNKSSEKYYFNQMLSGVSLLTIINTFTITGLLNSYDAITPLLLGLFWGLKSFNRKKRPVQKQIFIKT